MYIYISIPNILHPDHCINKVPNNLESPGMNSLRGKKIPLFKNSHNIM